MRGHVLAATSSTDTATDERFAMDAAEFTRFYEATVRPLRGYLARMSGNVALADDLTQEAYFRLLTVAAAPTDARVAGGTGSGSPPTSTATISEGRAGRAGLWTKRTNRPIRMSSAGSTCAAMWGWCSPS